MAISTHRLLCVVGCILAAASTAQGVTFAVTQKIVYDTEVKCMGTTTGRIPEYMLTIPTGTTTCVSGKCVETPAGSGSVYVTTSCSTIDSVEVTSTINSFLSPAPTYSFMGTNNFPYVGVEKYTAGKGCASAGFLLSKALYLADAKCHKASPTFSYRCFVGYGARSVTVTTYTDSTCSTGKAVIVDTTSSGTNLFCDGTASSTTDTKMYPNVGTFLYLSSTASYDSKKDDCKSPAVPTQLVTSVVPVDTCSATTSCSVTGDVYAGISCSSAYSSKTDWAAIFGANAYIVVEKYAPGEYCSTINLLGMTTYLADGKCHQTTTMSSFLVTSSNVATIKTYADSSTCAGTGVTLALTPTLMQNSCANDGNGILDTKVYGYGTTPYYLTLKVSYETKVGDCKSPAVPSQIVIASKDIVDACVPVPTCAGTVVPFSSTACSTPSTYHADVSALYGVYPFVTLEKYDSYSCKAPQLSSITTYVADGKCHKTSESSSYYRCTRAADGSATVTSYISSSTLNPCGGTGSALTITAAQAIGNSCLDDVNGLYNAKVYGVGVTPFYLLTTVKYETNTGDCKSPVTPALLSAAIVAVDSCTPTTTCSGTAPPYSSIACSSTLSFKADTAAVFGKSPYLVVEKYVAGQSCDATKLSSISAYLADGKCHKTGTSASYVATRASDGFGSIKTFADSISCATTGTILTVPTANSTCILAGVADVKVYGDGNTPVYLSSIISYDTIANTCAPPAVPTLLSASVVSGENCAVSTACSGPAGPFSRTTCGSTQSFKADAAVVFGSSPYVVVEKYVAGQACNLTKLSDITVYLADGKCRKTSAASSYAATRAADSSAVVKVYADSSTCATKGVTIAVTAAQATGNMCIASITGLGDIKSYGDGKTPLVISSSLSYDSNSGDCKWPAVPTQATSSQASVDVCTTSTTCSGTGDPYSGSKCSSILTWKEDTAAAFGLNPYLVVEKYVVGESCNPAKILSTTAYLADGECHKTGTSASYAATRAADGSAVIATYTTSAVCASTAVTLAVTAAQSQDNTCVSTANAGDVKCYGDGRSPTVFFSTLSYDTKAGDCKWPVVPTKIEATLVPDDACAASRSCSGAVDSYSTTACSSVLSFKSEIAAAFGSSPYVVVETYQPGNACDPAKLSGIAAYLADDKCHKTSASESYAAIRAADGSALIKVYADSSTCATKGETITVTAAQARACIPSASNDIKSYSDGITPTMVLSAVNYETSAGDCKWPVVPTQIESLLVSSETCTVSNKCSGETRPYSATKCSFLLTWKEDMATAFGSNPYVVVERYIAGQNCEPGALSGMTTYLANGKCHMTDTSSSYVATRMADGSATITTFVDSSSCATAGANFRVNADDSLSNVCIPAAMTGIGDVKLYGDGFSPLYVGCSNMNVDECEPDTMRTQVVASVVNDEIFVGLNISGTPTPLIDDECRTTDLMESILVSTTTGSTTIRAYPHSATCTGNGISTTVTVDQVMSSACPDPAAGFPGTADSGDVNAAPEFLMSTVSYDSNVGDCETPVVPAKVSSSVLSNDSCVESSACSGSANSQFTGTSCSTISTYQDDVAASFGSTPYVIVEKFAGGSHCGAASLVGITTYAADGKCHPTNVFESFRVFISADESVTISTYANSRTCSGSAFTYIVDAKGPSCHSVGDGFPDLRVVQVGKPRLYLSSTISYDPTFDPCEMPMHVSTTVLPIDVCAASAKCGKTIAGQFASKACNIPSSFRAALKTKFESTAFVIVEKYAAGKRCDASALAGITTYVADGKCHKLGTSSSFRATRMADRSAMIVTYTDSACSTTGSTLAVTAEQASGNSCADDEDGILDTKVFGDGETPMYFSSMVNYDSKSGGCKSPAKPARMLTTVVTGDSCVASTTCTGTVVPFSGTACGSSLTFKTDAATAFGLTAYVIVEKYAAGNGCDPMTLVGITTYVADGKCHKSGASSSFRATRKADGSASVVTYTDSATCSTTGWTLAVTSDQALGNSCAYDEDGILDTKVFGDGETPMYFSSTVNYDSSTGGCKSPTVPSSLVTTVLLFDSCVESTTCTGTAIPFSGTACGSSLTYKTDVATAFGSTAYVIVEKYAAGKSCDASALAGITTYVADGKCHKSGAASSFRTTRKADGSASIITYTDSATCGTAGSTLSVTADQVSGNSCADDEDGIPDTKVYGNGETPLFFSLMVNYDSSTGECRPPVVPTSMVTAILSSDSCVESTACTGTVVPFSGTACGSSLTYKTDVATAFGSTAYVIVEKYSIGKSCDPSALTEITAYVADGKCHKSEPSLSFRATRKADESALIVMYTDSACSTTGSTLSVSVDQASGNSCADDGDGIPDTKVYGDGATPLFFSSTVSYDSNTGICKQPAVPSSMVTTLLPLDSCVESTTCTGTVVPFSGTACGSSLTFKTDVATAFGSTAYVIVEKYAAGKSCDTSALAGITTYVADGKCHKSGASSSFRATRKADESAAIITYTDSACSTTGSTLYVTAGQVSGNTCEDNDDGILDTKVYGDGATPLFFSSTVNYDSNTGMCKQPAVPARMVTTVLSRDSCVASTTCTGTVVPFSGTACGSSLTYKTDVATAFGSTAYVIVEKYSIGKSCDPSALTGITTYVADGKCHKSGTLSSFRVTRKADESATIITYTNSATCSTTGSTLSVTSDQATGNSCAATSDGIPDMKVYGGGVTPLYLSSTVNYDSNTGMCKSPVVPARMVTTVVTGDSCVASTTCTGTVVPFSGTACGSSLTYKTDVATAFGTTAYVIVEKYTAGKSCDASALTGVTTYVADGKCHKSGTLSSFRVTRKADESATIVTYTDSATCGTTGSTLSVTADQASGNSCAADSDGIPDTKVYGDGATPLFFSSTVNYDSSTGGCKSPVVPARMVTTVLSKDSCVASTTCTGTAVPYSGTACGSSLTYKTDVATGFGSTAYVIVEKYTAGKSCDASTLTGITTYIADAKCHKSGTTSSFRATRKTDRSATVITYTDSATCGTMGSTLSVTAAQFLGNSCSVGANGILDTKIYTSA